VHDRDAFGAERRQHGGVVDELTENRERRSGGAVDRQRDRVADAKAHADVSCAADKHCN
jgi:hypothetical protein